MKFEELKTTKPLSDIVVKPIGIDFGKSHDASVKTTWKKNKETGIYEIIKQDVIK